jgi:hypothetical protein
VPSWEVQLAEVRIGSHNDHTYEHTMGMLAFTVITSVFSFNTLGCHTNSLFYSTKTLFSFSVYTKISVVLGYKGIHKPSLERT